mgnify:FL=1
MIRLQASIANATRNTGGGEGGSGWIKVYFRLCRSAKSWRMEAPTGHTKKEKKREQVRLKGRRCRVHKGEPPRRGPGRTAHGRG